MLDNNADMHGCKRPRRSDVIASPILPLSQADIHQAAPDDPGGTYAAGAARDPVLTSYPVQDGMSSANPSFPSAAIAAPCNPPRFGVLPCAGWGTIAGEPADGRCQHGGGL